MLTYQGPSLVTSGMREEAKIDAHLSSAIIAGVTVIKFLYSLTRSSVLNHNDPKYLDAYFSTVTKQRRDKDTVIPEPRQPIKNTYNSLKYLPWIINWQIQIPNLSMLGEPSA